jgi:hypothetical protein
VLSSFLSLEFYLPDITPDDQDSDNENWPDSVSEAIARTNSYNALPRPPPYYYSPSTSPTRTTLFSPPSEEILETIKSPDDVMLELSIAYKGDMKLSLTTSLIVNHPTPRFLSLPISLNLTGFGFTGNALIAYLSTTKSVGFCLREGGGLQDVRVESKVGDVNRQGMNERITKC